MGNVMGSDGEDIPYHVLLFSGNPRQKIYAGEKLFSGVYFLKQIA